MSLMKCWNYCKSVPETKHIQSHTHTQSRFNGKSRLAVDNSSQRIIENSNSTAASEFGAHERPHFTAACQQCFLFVEMRRKKNQPQYCRFLQIDNFNLKRQLILHVFPSHWQLIRSQSLLYVSACVYVHISVCYLIFVNRIIVLEVRRICFRVATLWCNVKTIFLPFFVCFRISSDANQVFVVVCICLLMHVCWFMCCTSVYSGQEMNLKFQSIRWACEKCSVCFSSDEKWRKNHHWNMNFIENYDDLNYFASSEVSFQRDA